MSCRVRFYFLCVIWTLCLCRAAGDTMISLHCGPHVKASVAVRYRSFFETSYLFFVHTVYVIKCVPVYVCGLGGWGGFFFDLPFFLISSLDSIFFFLSCIRSLWFCPASQFFMELQHFKEFFFSPLLLPRRSAGQVWERGTAHQRLAAISRGPHVSNSGQP